jgi:hypothetical protein
MGFWFSINNKCYNNITPTGFELNDTLESNKNFIPPIS